MILMKKIIAIIAALCIMLTGVSVFAEQSADKLIVGVYACSGKLFYCDSPTSRVVIKSVTPQLASPEAAQTAREAEYLEISIASDGLRMNDGSAIAIGDLNAYADSDVWFIIAKSADGNLSIPYLCFK